MPPLMHGTLPLTARLEPWMKNLVEDPQLCKELLCDFGSPLNVHDYSAMGRNIAQLRDAAAGHGVDFQIYLARKANKTLGAIDKAMAEGCGVDVASFHELEQCLQRGVSPESLIVTAAVKSRALLQLAVEHHVVLSLDNTDEALQLLEMAKPGGKSVPVALRLASGSPQIPPTRFGLSAQTWLDFFAELDHPEAISVTGVHFHLNGYSGEQRAVVLQEALDFADALSEHGHAVQFVDMGGGIPMSYLDDSDQWNGFWQALAELPEGDESLTWKSDRLGATGPQPSTALYPYHQQLIRGPWLEQILAARSSDGTQSIAQMLRARGIQLRCEPGRSLLDGCGLTLTEVAFTKQRSDGVSLVGLHMNRTQCRSAGADFLVDPILVTGSGRHAQGRSPYTGFLVGAYCIEEEVILRRRFEFPQGVSKGDIIAFPNTGGYLMHIIESASHQLPLAKNVRLEGSHAVLDDIDQIGAGLG